MSGELGHSRRIEMMANPKAAIALTQRVGSSWAVPSPSNTPIKLANKSAVAVPKKTALGDLELPPNAIAAT